MEQRLIVFDVNGVLIDTRSGALKDILILLGRGSELSIIDEEYQRRRKFGPWGLEEVCFLYHGLHKNRMERVARQYCQQNLMRGAAETIAQLKLNDWLVGAITSDADFVVDSLAQILSLDFAFGNKLEYTKNICTGKILEKIDRYRKAEILKEIMEKRGLKKEQVFAVGDSLTDIPIGKEAGVFIGFRPKMEIRKEVDYILEERNLEQILTLFNL